MNAVPCTFAPDRIYRLAYTMDSFLGILRGKRVFVTGRTKAVPMSEGRLHEVRFADGEVPGYGFTVWTRAHNITPSEGGAR